MTPTIVISYDGSAEDADGIALGRVFVDAGASAALAYVRHSREEDPAAEERERERAAALLARGAAQLGVPGVRTLVVAAGSTAAGLTDAVAQEGADLLIFGSAYRTAAGRIAPGLAAERLLDGGSVAVALAPAHMADRPAPMVQTIAVSAAVGDDAPGQTAAALAACLGANVIDAPGQRVDMLIIGSRPDAADGCVSITAVSEKLAEAADCPVLILPRGRPVIFGA